MVFQFVEEAVVRNFVKCFLEIEKDGVCLYSIIDIVCKIVYELDKLCFCWAVFSKSVLRIMEDVMWV